MAWSQRRLPVAVRRQILIFLDATDLQRWAQASESIQRDVARELRAYRHQSAHLGLGLWCLHRLTLVFESHYQELETRTIPRGHGNANGHGNSTSDPRVPPRVVSIWSERGAVPNGRITLRPTGLPRVISAPSSGVILTFTPATEAASGASGAATTRPMLTNVVQTQRRIYTVVTLELAREEATAAPVVLRRLTYIKEFGEWRERVTTGNKRQLDAHGALCRYDLVSFDGAMALELDLPAGADSLLDYFLVKRAVVAVGMHELFSHARVRVPTLYAPHPLPAASRPIAAHVMLVFTSLRGDSPRRHCVHGTLTRERQSAIVGSVDSNDDPPTSSASRSSTTEQAHGGPGLGRTALERFDILTFRAEPTPGSTNVLPLPTTPGFVWMTLRPESDARSYVYRSVMLHPPARPAGPVASTIALQAAWVPGVLEFYPTPSTRQRRNLKARLEITTHRLTHVLQELVLVAQDIPTDRLRQYAASIESSARPIPTSSEG